MHGWSSVCQVICARFGADDDVLHQHGAAAAATYPFFKDPASL